MPRVSSPSPARQFPLLGLGLGSFGHALAWSLYGLLGLADDNAAIPAWATLLIHFGGPESVLAVFSLASMLWLAAGVQEVMNDGWPRSARALGLVCAAIALALAWRWYEQSRPILTTFALLCSLPGLLGPAAPRPTSAAPPASRYHAGDDPPG